MRFVKKLFRPIYRAFFERPIWWFLGKVKAFFFAETLARLDNMERQLSELAGRRQDWSVIEERLRAMEVNNAAQWNTLEQLILALFQQPDQPSLQSAWEANTPQNAHGLSGSRAYGLNGPDAIR